MLEVLDFLKSVPAENRLWNREDFKTYRRDSPLNHSLFAWSTPPKDFLKDFPYHEDLGDLSLSIDVRSGFLFKTVVRLKDPEKTVYMNDILNAIVSGARGIVGGDEVFRPILQNVKVSQDNKSVVVAATISEKQLIAVKDRIIHDLENPDDAKTLADLRKILKLID